MQSPTEKTVTYLKVDTVVLYPLRVVFLNFRQDFSQLIINHGYTIAGSAPRFKSWRWWEARANSERASRKSSLCCEFEWCFACYYGKKHRNSETESDLRSNRKSDWTIEWESAIGFFSKSVRNNMEVSSSRDLVLLWYFPCRANVQSEVWGNNVFVNSMSTTKAWHLWAINWGPWNISQKE